MFKSLSSSSVWLADARHSVLHLHALQGTIKDVYAICVTTT